MAKGIRKMIKWTSLLAIMGVIAMGGLFLYGKYEFERPGPVALEGVDQTVVLIKPGANLRRISKQLAEAGVIRDQRLFAVAVRVQGAGAALQAGEYGVPSEASMSEISILLQSGKSILHRLTLAEGLTSAQIIRFVASDEILTGGGGDTPSEGTLLPETYLFTRGTSRSEIISRMEQAQDDLLADLWLERASELPFDSPEEAIILASIVEKETGLPEERPRIAAVFVNRLRRGQRLQSDPTIIYGLTQGEPLGRGIRRSELDRKTPYNTYQITGLPPTPIANPGRASIEAVLNPPDTKELYFVADGSGGHVFARTLKQHNRNVAKWRRIEREQKRR